jgi:hypothetical protein
MGQKQGTVAGLALVGLGLGQAADAATFNVTNLDDNGPGSLRQAISDANAAGGADVITFQAGLTGTITLTTGQLEVTDSVDIQGPGAAVLAVSGNNSSRVFYLYSPSALLDITLSGLTITGGADNIGGGIADFDENLTLDHVVISGNEAIAGGGLWMDGFNFTATIRDSVISGNTAAAVGGGVYAEDTGGPLLIQRTTIADNQAGESGGGIYLYDPDFAVTIEDSTISGNTAQAGGGGFFAFPQDITVRGSTISGNQATVGNGGGIYLYALYGGGSATLEHSTIAGNTAAGSGGGMFTRTGPVVLGHTIVADNTAKTDNDLATVGDGSFDLSFSLVESPGGANLSDNGGNLLGQDPQLGPLQDNGGPTQTHRPANASPAVNAGDPAFAPPPSTDQRGLPRIAGGRIDIGAVEINPGIIQLTTSAVSVSEGAATVTLTATRTNGSDGAVSVAYATSDGTAAAPADYGTAAGTLNWADGDTANKSFQVTIVNDALDELDETFRVTLSNPTGGVVLGATIVETVTVQDDDGPVVVNPVEVPTLGDYGKLLLAGLLGAGGLLALRRREIPRA